MPHSTFDYLFEMKVMSFAGKFSYKISSDNKTFLMTFDSNGSISKIVFEKPEPSWFDYLKQLKEQDVSYLFYDPFDAPEYTWVEWNNIEQQAMDRLIGEKFEDKDFISIIKNQSKQSYSSTWSVMF